MRVLLKNQDKKLDTYEIKGAGVLDDHSIYILPVEYSDHIVIKGIPDPDKVIKYLFTYSYLCLVQYHYEFARLPSCEDIPLKEDSEREIDVYEEFGLEL